MVLLTGARAVSRRGAVEGVHAAGPKRQRDPELVQRPRPADLVPRPERVRRGDRWPAATISALPETISDHSSLTAVNSLAPVDEGPVGAAEADPRALPPAGHRRPASCLPGKHARRHQSPEAGRQHFRARRHGRSKFSLKH